MRFSILLLAIAMGSGCSTLPDPSCQARLEGLRADPALDENERAAKIERQI